VVWAGVATTAIALAAGALIPRLPRWTRAPAHVVATGLAVAVATRAGIDAADLGCAPRDLARGARLGATTAATAATVVAVAATLPSTRARFADARVTGVPGPRAAIEVLVRIPLVTALGEELLFRGVVLGTWRRVVPTPIAVAISSAAFGVWHVLPARDAHGHVVGAEPGRATHVAGTVLTTAAAGAAFAGLRLRSGSVLAPTLAHAAVNQAGYLATRWAHARRQPAGAPPAAAKSDSATRRTIASSRASGSSPRSRASR
jgi:membrane protease YdiL (CAAX protease family)